MGGWLRLGIAIAVCAAVFLVMMAWYPRATTSTAATPYRLYLAVAFKSAETLPSPTATPTPTQQFTSEALLSRNLHNEARAANGVQPLVLDAAVSTAAQNQANDMAMRGYFSHDSPEGKTPWDWLREAGVDFGDAGQNLAFHTVGTEPLEPAIQAIFDTIMAETPPDDGHRLNVLNPNYRKLGMGIARSTGGDLYWICNFTD